MHVHMRTAETLNPDQISQFLALGETIEFAGQSRAERYAFAQQLLVAQEYARQGKKQRGAIRAYLSKMTGLGVAQTARLIQMYIATGAVELRGYRRHEFVSKYTDGDVRLLANVDRAHERLSGPATCCILRREYERFGKAEYARLAQISVSHLYNLRNGTLYRKHAAVYQPTRPYRGIHRGTAQAEPSGAAGLSAHRYGASGGLGRQQGGLSHQCGGYGHTVAGGGMREQDQRSVSAPGAGSDPASVSVRDSGLARRQRLGVHQLHGGRAVGENAGGVHQEPGQPQSGQCAGGRQERCGGTQAYRVRLHWRRACRAAPEVLHGALQPILELPSSVRVRDGQPGCARQAQTGVQGSGLSDATREVAGHAGGGETLKAEHQLGGLGAAGDADERYRVRPQNDDRESEIAARLQDGITAAAEVSMKAPQQGRGNDGAVESVENHEQVSPSSHRPLEISQGRRDSHIPTARRRPARAGGRPKRGRRPSPAKRATATASPSSEQQNQTLGRSARKTGARPLAVHPPLPFQYHLALETKVDFSIILRLENAQRVPFGSGAVFGRPGGLSYSEYRPAASTCLAIWRPIPMVSAGSCLDRRRRIAIWVLSISPSATAAITLRDESSTVCPALAA